MKPTNSSNFLTGLLILAIGLASAGYSQQSFQITSLSSSGPTIIEHEPYTGDDRGGIALSSTSVFYTGDNQTGRFDLSGLSNPAAIPHQYDSLVSNLRTKQAYALGTTFGIVTFGGDLVTRLVPLDPTTGEQISGDILLSTPIYVQSGSTAAGIFSGWDRIVLMDGNTMIAYNVDLPSGNVTSLGPANLYVDNSGGDRCGCESWATWGVAEYTGGSVKLVYAASPWFSPFGFAGGSIKRYDLSNGNISTVADFPSGLSDMCSLTVDPTAGRWYFHFEGYSGAFGFGGDENVGYAPATFLTPSSSTATISGRVLVEKGHAISGAIVTATDFKGVSTRTTTNAFGNYVLSKLQAGQTYVVTVSARKYFFPVSSEVVNLDADVAGLDFEAK